jgi:hypothetical protein
MLKVASDDKTFTALALGLVQNKKHKFDVKVGKWSITVRGDLDVAVQIVEMFRPEMSPIRMKRGGGKLFIYDSDVYLNRRFLSIFGPIAPNAKHAQLGLSLTA